jgi:hypothetical protein
VLASANNVRDLESPRASGFEVVVMVVGRQVFAKQIVKVSV